MSRLRRAFTGLMVLACLPISWFQGNDVIVCITRDGRAALETIQGGRCAAGFCGFPGLPEETREETSGVGTLNQCGPCLDIPLRSGAATAQSRSSSGQRSVAPFCDTAVTLSSSHNSFMHASLSRLSIGGHESGKDVSLLLRACVLRI